MKIDFTLSESYYPKNDRIIPKLEVPVNFNIYFNVTSNPHIILA